MQTVYEEIVRQLTRERQCLGIVLYGSFARGSQNRYSDIDILCVVADFGDSREEWQPELRSVAEFQVEIHTWPVSAVRRIVSTDGRRDFLWQFQLVILALGDGIALYDKDGEVRELQRLARELKVNGPPAMQPQDRRMAEITLGAELEHIRRGLARSAATVRVLCSMVFVSTVELYCRCRGFWLPKLLDIINRAKHLECALDPRLHTLCLQYLSGHNNDELIKSLEAMVTVALDSYSNSPAFVPKVQPATPIVEAINREGIDVVLGKVVESAKHEIEGCVGSILYGSYATGAYDARSSIDILCVTQDQARVERTGGHGASIPMDCVNLGELGVDVSVVSAHAISRALCRTYHRNNNFFLNALTTGIILHDDAGVVRRLVGEAAEVRSRGPSAPTEQVIQLARIFFLRSLVELKHTDWNETSMGLFRVLSDFLFVNGLYGYCCCHRRWGSDICHTIQAAEGDDARLFELCQCYLRAAGPVMAIQALEELLDAAIQPVGWGSAEEFVHPRKQHEPAVESQRAV